jgi:hypothetical protein
MNQYLVDTRYAVENLFILLYREHEHLDQALESEKSMRLAEKDLFEGMQKSSFTPEGIIDLYGYHDAAERFKTDATNIVKKVATIDASLHVIAGSILQIAKQGISAVHKKLSICPSGRIIGNESLKNIIWQGRNQAMHFEDGNYHPQTITCFKNLEFAFGSKFLLGQKNLALEVIEILGWKKYLDYENDMKTLLP